MRISARGREVWLSGQVRPQHGSEARLTGAKQFRDDIASLRECDEGDELASNIEEDPRGSLSWT